MKVVVMGAGILGVSTAWYLLERGHEVTVVDRQAAAALETSFANGAQISVGFSEPWASAAAPWKVLKWLPHDDSPLLFRLRLDLQQWRWGLAFLANCNDAAFERNVAQLVALGRYSHASLRALAAQTGIAFDRLERGILHFYATQRDLDGAAAGAALMHRHGLERRVLGRDEVLAVEPALRAFDGPIAGGTFTPSDESGDAFVFTQALAQRCAERGAHFLFAHDITDLEVEGGRLQAVRVVHRLSGESRRLDCDAGVAALGSYTAPFLRRYGVDLKIEPAKGYSATVALRRPETAPVVSLIDDARKIAVSRLGNRLRVAGTAELAGYDTGIQSERSQLRCNALLKRLDSLFPGVADLSQPNFWAGLRPSTPNNVPYIGRSRIDRLWLNAGHGTLGWTHGTGSGRALAELISGHRPELDFAFCGDPQKSVN